MRLRRKLYCEHVIITLLTDPHALRFCSYSDGRKLYFMSEIIVLSLVQFDEMRSSRLRSVRP